jgi:hypothetical protein
MQGFLLLEIDPKEIKGLEEQIDSGSNNNVDHTDLKMFTLSEEADSDMTLCWLPDRLIQARMDLEFDIGTGYLTAEAAVGKIPTTRITLTFSVPDPKDALVCGMWAHDSVRAGVFQAHPHEGVVHKLITLVVDHGDQTDRVRQLRIMLLNILQGKEKPSKPLQAWVV